MRARGDPVIDLGKYGLRDGLVQNVPARSEKATP